MDWNSRRITTILENALLEDRATRDATSYACIEPNQRAAATIVAKQDCILAGLGCIARILDVYAVLDGAVTSHYEVTSHPEIFDGVRLHDGQSAAVIRHNARVILSCERVILNFLQRMSGIATLTRKFVEDSRPCWSVLISLGAANSLFRSKCVHWKSWNRHWSTAPK